MKPGTTYICPVILLLLLSCESQHAKNKTSQQSNNDRKESNTNNNNPTTGIIGEWEQQYTYADKNGNYTLEPEEKQPSNTRLGFNWFRFNADGSCLRDKEVKFKSTYEIQEKGATKELIIHNVHGYTITELTDKELILGADGIFIVFKRIK